MSFTPNTIQDHCRSQDTPEILSSLEINEKVTDMESLLKYSISVLNFLEENKLNSDLYPFKGPEFAFLFQKFEAYYETTADMPKRIQLIRTEYLIRLIAGYDATQDISVYIKSLLQEMHDKPEIYELIRLFVSKKGQEFFKPFAITFSKFIIFISPFLRYLRTISLDFLKIFKLSENEIQVIAKQHLMELKNLLGLDPSNPDGQSLLEELSELKTLIKQDYDNDLYYEQLGLWSFIYHLSRNQDHTFLHICLTASSYFSRLEQINQISTSHHKLKELNQMGSVNYRENTWQNLIKQILTEFNDNIDLLKLLHSALLLSNENIDFFRQLLEAQTKNSPPLFFELWEFLWKQKDSSHQYLEGFLSYIDSMIYVVSGLFKLSFSTASKLVKDSFDSSYQQQYKPMSNCRALLKNQHYLLQFEILGNYPSWSQKILQNLSFSDTPLIQILESSPMDNTDLSLNLRETFKVIQSKRNSLTKEDHQNLRLLFQKYLDIITNNSTDFEREKLKIIGFFLTKILTIAWFLRKIKVSFISAFIKFLDSQRSQLPWEFHKNICNLVTSQNFSPLLENEHFINFVNQIEIQASQFNKEPECLFSEGQLRYLPLAQERFHKLILTSLENIKQELDLVTVKKVQELWKRFTLFTLNWLLSYVKMILPKKKAAFGKIEEMLSIACSIYLHPSFLMYISQKQKSSMQLKFIKILQQTKHGKSFVLEKYFSHLKTEVSQLIANPQLVGELFLNHLKSDPIPSEIPSTLSALKVFYFPERLKAIPELFGPKETISLLKSLRVSFYDTTKYLLISNLPQLLVKIVIPLASTSSVEFQKYTDAIISGIANFIDLFNLEKRHTEIKPDFPRLYENFLSEAIKEDVINTNASYLIDKIVVASQKLPENCKVELKKKILIEDFWWIYTIKRTNHYLKNYQDSTQISRWYETLQYITSHKNLQDLNQYGTFQLKKLISSVVFSLSDIINKKPLDFIEVYQEFWLQKTLKQILEIICLDSIFLKNQYTQDADETEIADLKALIARNLDIYIIFETYKDLHIILNHTADEMATILTKHCLQVLSAPDENFPESKISKLFYIEMYSVPLISLIIQQKANSIALQDDTLFLLIQKKTGTIVEELFQEIQQFPQHLSKIENTLQNITKLQLNFLTYFAMQNRDCSTLFAPTFAWISSIFKLHSAVLDQSSQCLLGSAILLEFLAALTQIALFSSPILASSYLLEKTNLISSFLTVKTQTSRATDTYVTILTITLDLYFWNALPSETTIELDLKKELLKRYYFNLPKRYPLLTNQGRMFLEQERTNFNSLVDTLIEKFGFEEFLPNSTPVLKFDPSKEIQASQCPQKIDQVINSLSTNAQNIIRLLTYSLLQNYSSNLAQLNKPSHEVSGIMQVLATFAKKYPAVTLYLVFAKNDYTSIFADQDYHSITFLDCLFKSKFFYMQAAAFHLLIEPLVIPSGITFLLDTSNQLSDLSHIFLIKLISSLSNQLDRILNNPASILEDNSIILVVMNLVYYMQTIDWFSKNSSPKDTKFPEALTIELALLFANTLAAFQVLNTTAYLAFENFDDIYGLITLWLKSYYKDQLNQLPPNPDTKINKIKCDHYFQFLTRSDQVLSSFPTISTFETLLHTIQSETKFEPQTLHQHYMNSHQSNTSFSPFEIKVWSILSNQRQDLTFTLPYCGMRQEILKKTAYWSDYESLVSKQMQGLADFSENKQFQHLGAYLTQKTLRLVPNILLYSSLPSINSLLISNPNKTLKTWEPSNLNLFQELSSRLSQKETNNKNIQLEWIKSDSKPKETFIHHQKNPTTLDQKEKYFADYLKQPQSSVLSAQRALLLKLKIITEKVLASKTLNSSISQKEIANTEINQVSEAERPLLLCLIERFSLLKKLYDYPPEFEEIQAEFRYIKAKYPNSFPNTLISSDYQSPNFFDDQSQFCSDLTLEAQENQDFTVDGDQVIEKNITFLIQQVSAFPDEVVESIIRIFLNSPAFEIKLLDFCFLFLYCGAEIIQTNAADTGLPCTKIYNISANLPPSEVYAIATANILNFLKDLIQKREYPLYLPRFFFEQYSLKKLQLLNP